MFALLDRKGQVNLKSEDALTAAVFGALRYLPDRILLEWLGTAEDRAGDRLELDPAGEIANVDFWPVWPDALRRGGWVEPDVVVEVSHGLIVIEAKLWSTKPGRDEQHGVEDQLARQWASAVARGTKARHPYALVFVTNHTKQPRDDLDASMSALNRHGVLQARLYWTSWSKLGRVLQSTVFSSESARRISLDILGCLDLTLGIGLLPFTGWSIAELNRAAEISLCGYLARDPDCAGSVDFDGWGSAQLGEGARITLRPYVARGRGRYFRDVQPVTGSWSYVVESTDA